jgi:Fic family protein
LPDRLLGRPLVLDPAVDSQAGRAERAVRGLLDAPGAGGLEGLARFLLRSEAIASSRIEGLAVSPQQVGLAELAAAQGLSGRGLSSSARLVANNITALARASADLTTGPAFTVENVCDLHAALLPDEPEHGLRTVQSWVGGSDWHPLDAEFVPPPPESVVDLMTDLVTYGSGGAHAPLIQAGLLHAQFETIHPFRDGNGRVGRALIHTVLIRRGLTRHRVLPVSLVLLTRSDEYVAGLTDYRYAGDPDSEVARAGVSRWLCMWLDAIETAVDQSRRFVAELAELRQAWDDAHARHRTRLGRRAAARGDSAAARLLGQLPEAPVLTARSVQTLLDVSFQTARAAVEELAQAGILHRRRVERGTTAYLARDVFDLLAVTERRLASTRWDTREATPQRAVPAGPGQRD